MAKLKINHWYKINDGGRVRIGQYTGREDGYSCCVCGRGHKAYQFNFFYAKDQWETLAYGSEHLNIIEDIGDHEEQIIDK